MKKARIMIGRSVMCALKEVVTGERWRLTQQFGTPATQATPQHDAHQAVKTGQHEQTQTSGHSL